jgi:CheY-like chemotaxis protein
LAHILLVDDDHELAARHARAIERAGHTVTVSPDPASALVALAERLPDVVVLEAMFGGRLTGIELAHKLASDHPDLPMIMLTRADEHLTPDEIADQDHDQGWIPVRRYLAKPLMRDVLVDEIEHLLDD